MGLFISIFIKFFFLLTPFFVLSVFLSLTKEMTPHDQKMVVFRTILAVIIISAVLYFVGNEVFATLGITLDAFRIGAGSLLFLSAVALVQGNTVTRKTDDTDGDFSVVPLAIPITVGPATIGSLLIIGAELSGADRLVGFAALISAICLVGVLLLIGPAIRRVIGPTGIDMLTKLTGLVLSALAAQIVFTGIKNFLH